MYLIWVEVSVHQTYRFAGLPKKGSKEGCLFFTCACVLFCMKESNSEKKWCFKKYLTTPSFDIRTRMQEHVSTDSHNSLWPRPAVEACRPYFRHFGSAVYVDHANNTSRCSHVLAPCLIADIRNLAQKPCTRIVGCQAHTPTDITSSDS